MLTLLVSDKCKPVRFSDRGIAPAALAFIPPGVLSKRFVKPHVREIVTVALSHPRLSSKDP